MTDIPPVGPTSSDESKKHQELEKIKGEKPTQGEEENVYLGFTFNSKASYLQFKTKFLANMANLMIRQIKKENDQMLKALKKMREDL